MYYLFSFLAQIAYTEGCYMQVRVHAEVVDPRTGQRDTTNVFHFTVANDKPVHQVWPKTYGGQPFSTLCFISVHRIYVNIEQTTV